MKSYIYILQSSLQEHWVRLNTLWLAKDTYKCISSGKNRMRREGEGWDQSNVVNLVKIFHQLHVYYKNKMYISPTKNRCL